VAHRRRRPGRFSAQPDEGISLEHDYPGKFNQVKEAVSQFKCKDGPYPQAGSCPHFVPTFWDQSGSKGTNRDQLELK
jgi:hypothetical protein